MYIAKFEGELTSASCIVIDFLLECILVHFVSFL